MPKWIFFPEMTKPKQEWQWPENAQKQNKGWRRLVWVLHWCISTLCIDVVSKSLSYFSFGLLRILCSVLLNGSWRYPATISWRVTRALLAKDAQPLGRWEGDPPCFRKLPRELICRENPHSLGSFPCQPKMQKRWCLRLSWLHILQHSLLAANYIIIFGGPTAEFQTFRLFLLVGFHSTSFNQF